MGDAIHRLDHLDIVSPRGELFKGVPIGKGFFEFCTAQRTAKASLASRVFVARARNMAGRISKI